jgi:hypothetical protein
MKLRATARLLLLALASHGVNAAPLPAGVKGALDNEHLGLADAAAFRLGTDPCAGCTTLRPALWYFEKETVALPGQGQAGAGFSPGQDRVADVQRWAARARTQPLAQPSVAWIGAPLILENGRIAPDGKHVTTAQGAQLDLTLAPRLATNLSYANIDTMRFFGQRPVRMRGAIDPGTGAFVARAVWPLDFNLDSAKAGPVATVLTGDLASFVHAPAGHATRPETRVLWERDPNGTRRWEGKPVLGIVLDGAQGDDDESLGGHFAVTTGRFGARGEWADWMVNNFYNLDSVSEKGIIAASVPMDSYLMDLNSGQQYYRPSYMLVAVLRDARTAAAYQGAAQRTLNHFYRHDFAYHHARANCTGISIDIFRALGWHVPNRGPSAPVKAIGAYAYVAATDRSFASGRKIYDYLTEEQTRLYPAVAFDVAGQDLLRLVGALPAGPAGQRILTEYERQLKSDIEALVLVRIAQVPSSRAAGSAPVFSFDEYRSRVPKDQARWKIVPVAPRPFPAALREASAR